MPLARSKSAPGDGEGDVGESRVLGHDLNDHVDVDVGFGERAEDRGRDAGLVGDVAQRDLRLVARKGDAGDDLLLHNILLVANERAKLGTFGIVERRAHVELDLVHHGHLDRAHLQNLGSERRHFQHFLERHLVEPPRLRHDARVGRVYAVDVGIDVATVRLNRGGERHGGSVGAATPERRHPVRARVQPLKARHHRNLAALETPRRAGALDSRDAGGAMGVVGQDRNLPARPMIGP